MTAPVPSTGAAALSAVLPVLRAGAAAADEKACFPTGSLTALRTSGLLGLTVPTEYGGGGADLAAFTEVAAKLSGACLATGQIWAMHCFQVDAIARYGSPELKAELLPRVAAGEVYIASVTTEPGRSASLFEARAPLRPAGDRLLLERSAPVVTGGRHADGFLVTMRAHPEATANEVSLVYLDRADAEVEAGGGWDPLGMRATESIGLVLTGSSPTRNVVGPPGGFAQIARESMIPLSHLGWSACWLGAARGALRELVTSLRESGRTEYGDLFYERLARIRVDLEIVSGYLARVVEHVSRARAEQRPLATTALQLQLNTLKLVASEHTFSAVDRMVQLAGLRLGYLRDSPLPLERHFRDLRAAALNHANDSLWTGVGAFTLLDRSVDLA